MTDDRSGTDRPGEEGPGEGRDSNPSTAPQDPSGGGPRTRKQDDASASAALARMFDGPGRDGERAAPRLSRRSRRSTGRRGAAPVAQERAIHDAVMAGLDAFAGDSSQRAAAGDGSRREALESEGDDDTAELAGTREHAGALAVALAASDGEEIGGAGRGGAPVDASRFEDRYNDEELAEDLALAGLSGPRQRFNPLAALGRSLTSGLTQAGEMTWLSGAVIKSAITRPTGYWNETKEQIYSALKLCWVPMIISITAFGIGAPGLQGGNVFTIFGVPEREGSFIVATGIREFAPWIDAMIVAGVVGTAITADIGARRIREEIDAMEVLGVDPIRELVLPRILSTAIITGLFDIVALLVGIVGGYIASVILLGASTAGYTSQFFSQANVPDLIGSFAKTFLFGAVVGVVCCYKGMRASGGPSGVGKAVNSAVVISFALIWTINYVFTNTLLGFAPSTQVFH
ncbi:ABC transporter permease [Acidiferrimicrobium sp. IK]|uniref:MlaE family ABC transporter permease n=1 Tax=Acidiferrimicrobium sp. IK TaxID=2871700 RepID=UPI0021CAE8BD|nr:ABC transporter permease [Acidiferrimicrobium sp. IK]MCU4184400.1 ABC transporter permease [Acidiferrimicrobium sp. IK]